MQYASKTLERLVDAFSTLPGIGEKSAQRIALFLIDSGTQVAENLSDALQNLKEKVGHCSVCFNLTEEDPCALCRDSRRDRRILCVVEDSKDLLALERSGGYRGLYHILGGALSPLDGVGESDLHVAELLSRITPEVKEVILATNPTMEGEMTAAHIAKKLASKPVRVTRIARGVPFGGTLEFNDAVTLARALEGRSEIH
ncbi:MAG TPA: recombination protein RecR [bacterium]|nr:recombination protein RecR [bacterium]